ncbi:hypothetical protein ACFE04_009831 [Oxalis oulophora]
MNINVWSDIPTDILSFIWKRLHYKDKIVMGSVCKSWLLSGIQFSGGIQIDRKSPWLMLAEEDKHGLSSSNTVRNFFDLSTGKTLTLDLPETINKKCFSVGFGWLLIIGIHLNIELFHPLTGQKINLPHYSTFEDYDDEYYDYDFKKPKQIPLQKAIAFADPWDPKVKDFNPECIIMVTYDFGLPAFARLGDKAWTNVKIKHTMYSDILYYKSSFYAINERHLYACDVEGHEVTSTKQIAWVPRHLGYTSNKYLVESEGELLVVFRQFGGEFFPLNSHSVEISEGIKYLTTSFDVVRLIKKDTKKSKHKYKFEQVKTLNDRALFVGSGASFSLPATHFNGCRGDCIYFTDDSSDFYSATINGAGYDMGVYNLRDGIIDQHYKGESLSYFSPPFWYM